MTGRKKLFDFQSDAESIRQFQDESSNAQFRRTQSESRLSIAPGVSALDLNRNLVDIWLRKELIFAVCTWAGYSSDPSAEGSHSS